MKFILAVFALTIALNGLLQAQTYIRYRDSTMLKFMPDSVVSYKDIYMRGNGIKNADTLDGNIIKGVTGLVAGGLGQADGYLCFKNLSNNYGIYISAPDVPNNKYYYFQNETGENFNFATREWTTSNFVQIGGGGGVADSLLLFEITGTANEITVTQTANNRHTLSLDPEIACIGGLTSAANNGIYYTGSGTASLFSLTSAGRALLDDASASDQRTTLGLGSLATLSSVNNDNWSGTDLSVSNGGTGVSSTTAYGLICGGTSSTAAFQNGGTGTSGQVYKSAGSSSLGSWTTMYDTLMKAGYLSNTTDGVASDSVQVFIAPGSGYSVIEVNSIAIGSGGSGTYQVRRHNSNNSAHYDLLASAQSVTMNTTTSYNTIQNGDLSDGDRLVIVWTNSGTQANTTSVMIQVVLRKAK